MTTKYTLTNALLTGGPLKDNSGELTYVQSVEREDGSGKCYNVTGVTVDGSTKTIFVRTID